MKDDEYRIGPEWCRLRPDTWRTIGAWLVLGNVLAWIFFLITYAIGSG